MHIQNLTVHNFRSLVNVKIPLHPLNVVIGPNGSGKTALMEVLLLLQRGSQKELSTFFYDRGGFQAVFSQKDSRSSSSVLGVKVDLTNSHTESSGHSEYTIGLQSTGYGFEVAEESYRTQNNAGRQYQIAFEYSSAATNSEESFKALFDLLGLPELTTSEMILSQVSAVGREHLRTIPPLKKFFSGASYYQPIDVATRSPVRLPQALTPASMPGAQGESLYSALYNLRIHDPQLFERLLAIVLQAFPGFKRFDFPVVGAGQVTLAWHDQCCSQPFYPNQLSEGTLRFLWLLTLVVTAPRASLLLIDEPETSLHPELLRILALLLQEAALETQVIVATHSSDLISWLQPDEVLIADKADGLTRFTWADTLNLQNWLAEYSLRDLWLMGHLGGKP